ncbi:MULTISPECIES: ATP-binding cassette domain-containing protein [unclassified Dysgonomonas]|jgi:ATP-binding cassette subfamily C protein CydD|uniref:ATP-binding cassette domain-containing protein n=1 Tax=unclassified Dysgonomonas TaxID=2630389 RepID=UPI0025B81B54|nr:MULTISPECIES: ATP-binding cassette domain-containing protein [unclassified Dysgonomonas]MDR2002614.1 ATP-binding cassette domain-containing protein [Prevotella sp.]HMM01871.1 ATP-binding cassette domain-containing protein [Dysgonomonas sp.]
MSSNQENASRWLGKKIVEAKSAYISASILTVLSAGCFIIFCWYLSGFAASWLNDGQFLPNALLYASVFLMGRYIFAHYASLFNYKAGNIIVSKIKKRLYPILLNNNKLDSISSTLFVTRISDDLKPFYAFFIPYLMASLIVSGMLLVICFWMEKWVGTALLVSLVVIPMQMIIIGVGAEALHKKHINLFLKYSAVFYNRLQTIAEIVNLDNFKPQYLFLSKKSKELNKATTNVMRVAILSSAVLELFVTICIAIIAIYLGMSLLGIMTGPNYGKGYDFRTALFLLTLSPYFFFYLRKFVSAYHDRNKALASAKLLLPILNEDIDIPLTETGEALNTFEINGLSFAYPDSPVKVLHNISLKLPAKGLVLVKGISGSGKSTLLKICAGSLSSLDGLVSVNGRENKWSQQWLKANSSYMNQFPFIFDGTLRYNVFLEKEADKYSQYPEFLDKILTKKEEGWQTGLSHNGKQLSGGEKQLVTLARMMLHPKPIAILDEPTANLDTGTVEIILPQIMELAKNRLVIVASHERMFDTVADVIINLNWGEQMNYE